MSGPEKGVLRGIVCALTDSVMALAPRGWVALELEIASTPQGLKLAQLEAKGEGARAPRPKPDLGLDAQLEAQRLSHGLTELAHLIAHAGKQWKGGVAQVVRSAEALDWKLLDAARQPAWFTRLDGQTLGGLLVTDALFDAVAGTERAFALLQAALERAVGETIAHGFDGQAGTATLLREGASPAVVRAQVLGLYQPQSFTWQWGWALGSVPRAACEAVHRVCAPEAQPPGLAALWRPGYHCDEAFAWAVAGHLCVAIGARGIFRAELPQQGGALYLALLEDVPPRGN